MVPAFTSLGVNLRPANWPGGLIGWLRLQPTRWLVVAVALYLGSTLLSTALSACADALRAVGASRVLFLTPFNEHLNGLIRDHMGAAGFEASMADLGIGAYTDASKIGPDEVRLIPEAVARRFLVIPTPRIDDSTITVAMSDPVDIEAIDAVRSITNLEVHKAVATEDRIVAAIDKFYREDAHIESTLKDIVDVELDEPAEIRDASSINDNELRVIANDAPVVRFVNLLLL